MSDDRWFAGSSYSSYQGVITEVDLAGPLPRFNLLMPTNTAKISCVGRQNIAEDLKNLEDKKIRIYGLAQHEPHSVLPVWMEVTSFEIISMSVDFSRWKGAFESFEVASWDAELL
jgi:hypothetical protein